MGLTPSAARRIPQANASSHQGGGSAAPSRAPSCTARRLPFSASVASAAWSRRACACFRHAPIGCDPYCSPDRAEQLGVKLYDTTEEAIAEADFITVHLPKTATTIGMFGPEQFAAMKDGVVLVNTARGGIYDVDSLADFVAAEDVRRGPRRLRGGAVHVLAFA